MKNYTQERKDLQSQLGCKGALYKLEDKVRLADSEYHTHLKHGMNASAKMYREIANAYRQQAKIARLEWLVERDSQRVNELNVVLNNHIQSRNQYIFNSPPYRKVQACLCGLVSRISGIK